jgi:hypothetical protein
MLVDGRWSLFHGLLDVAREMAEERAARRTT